MGIGISHDVVASAAKSIVINLHTPFNYLGVKVGGIMSRLSSWDDVIAKLFARLSKWKLKSLSIGGRLTLIKSVLSSLPLYYMSSFKIPKGVLSKMESIRRNFSMGEKCEEEIVVTINGIRGALDTLLPIQDLLCVDMLMKSESLHLKGIESSFGLVKKKVGNGSATSFWNESVAL
ncbi:hypothetical protein Tco_0970600 [Tanacetum coccineum]